MSVAHEEPLVTIHHGDCREVMAAMPEASVDAIVCDPPYDLTAGKKGGSGLASVNLDSPYGRARIGTGNGGGFMGKAWDATGVAFDPATWRAALRVAKPGAHLLAFGGTRTHHRLMVALEDAGWEIRDCLMWLYGSGFPKSLDVSKAMDKAAGAEREDLGRHPNWREGKRDNGQSMGRVPNEARITLPATDLARQWQGWGTALKPSWEIIILARKPLAGTVAANVARWGTGALNVDGCRVAGPMDGTWGAKQNKSIGYGGTKPNGYRTALPTGRWPANLVLDEWDDPVLRLKNNVDPQVARIIRLYFGDVSNVPEAHPHIPQQEGPEEVLREEVLRGVLDPENRQEVAALRDQTHGRGEGPHGSGHEGASGPRPEGVGVEGRAARLARLRDAQRGIVDTEGATTVRLNVQSVERAFHPGASLSDGAEVGARAPALGGSTPSEWGQDGQSTRELGTLGQCDAQAQPRRDTPRGEASARGERGIEVRASEVPSGWLTFFAPTGRSVRCGSAAMLDEQSGEAGGGFGRSGGSPDGKGIYGRSFPRGNMAVVGYGDSGGASRFFYTAKADREDRDGSKHPTVKPVTLMKWLLTLVTPPDGVALDPFLGSGTTCYAARALGLRSIGIEQDAAHVKEAIHRLRQGVLV